MELNTLKIGFAGAVHPNMPGDDEGLIRTVAGEMKKLGDQHHFDLAVYPDIIRTEEDGEKARRFFDDGRTDLTILFNASLPFGRIILPFARVKSRLALWSVPEPAENGVLQLNSFCGTNMLGSIIGNYLRRYEIPFKWFYGMPGSEMFLERFLVTLKALRAVKALENANIAQIGGLADGFENLYIDERELEYKMGSRIQTRHTVEEIVARAEGYSAARTADAAEELLQEGGRTNNTLAREQVEKSARVFLAFMDFVREYGYTALGISCWSRFQEVYGIAVCSVLSRLNNKGIAASCEGDIPAVVNMIMFNAMTGEPSALNDLVAFDEKDGSLNLWHCGVAPGCFSNSCGIKWDSHFNIGHYEGTEWKGDGVVADMQFKPGEVTISTMNNSFDNLFILTGDVLKDKAGFSGSSGWVGNLAVNGQPASIKDIMNTIVVERVNHHYPTAFGSLVNELNEFAAWKNMNVLQLRPYVPYLQRPSF